MSRWKVIELCCMSALTVWCEAPMLVWEANAQIGAPVFSRQAAASGPDLPAAGSRDRLGLILGIVRFNETALTPASPEIRLFDDTRGFGSSLAGVDTRVRHTGTEQTTPGRFTWFGEFMNGAGAAQLTVGSEKVYAVINLHDTAISVEPGGSGLHIVREMEPSRSTEEHDPN